jgi:polyribonucleotide nucleotidyltransferase
MFNETIKSLFFDNRGTKIKLSTGFLARQATSVVVSMNETVVLVTVTHAKAKEYQNFLPLSVEYIEKNYAVGKIPGGFLKREGRPSEQEILIARLIDRSIRPLFPDDFCDEIQVIAQVLSLNPQIKPDILAMIGASAALSISGLPFQGPIAAVRVGYVDGQYVINPSTQELAESKLDLVVAGNKDAIFMVESEAKELADEIVIGAIVCGQEQIRNLTQGITEFKNEVNIAPIEYATHSKEHLQVLKDAIHSNFKEKIAQAYLISQKQARVAELDKIHDAIIANDTVTKLLEDSLVHINQVEQIISDLESSIIRNRILNGEPRIDGRDQKTVRPIHVATGILPAAHGSAVFTRGETQALGIVTVGIKTDEQLIDSISGIYYERFMLHYNFPPFSTGECGRVGSPKRREIGHGNLAKRGLKSILPTEDEFPYTLRCVSEVLESNGSSSMATVCTNSVALMVAGVPIKKHAAGIAMGLIIEKNPKDCTKNRFAVLTDILGDEDHLGDMDFKVVATRDGITALQMDIKTDGITEEILRVALKQAQEAIAHILNIMYEKIDSPYPLSDLVPRLYTMKVNPSKIKDIIGKGGSVIKEIIAKSGASIDIQDNGTVTIASNSSMNADIAKSMIEGIVAEIMPNVVYDATVIKILDKNIGVIVSLPGNKEGFVHISQISESRVVNINDHLKIGQLVKVVVLDVDEKGRIRLSIKNALSI